MTQTTPRPAEAATEPPTLREGFYRLNGPRWWRADELEVVWWDDRWCVVPRVALAALPLEETGDER